MDFRKSIGWLGVAVVVATAATGGFGGVGAYSSESGWTAASQIDPWVLPLSLIAIAVLVLSWRLPAQPRFDGIAQWYWVFLAFSVDFGLFAIAVAPAHLLHLIFEALATGDFSWSFERSYIRRTDPIIWILGLVPLAIFIAWYGRLPWAGRETPGCIWTGIAFEASIAKPSWGQIAVFPVKMVGLCFPPFLRKLAQTLIEQTGGYSIRCIR